jgi:tRNA/rRNA methyltransferase
MAAGADRILDGAVLYDSLEAAIGDCSFVFAATARAHDQAKPVVDAAEAAALAAPHVAAGETVALVFGRERNGLENDEVGLADRIITLPVNPAFASLNLGQAVVIVGYEWFKRVSGAALPFGMPEKSPPAAKEQLLAFFAALEGELEKVEFFRPPDKRATMQINLRNIFTRMQPTQQDIQTLHGVVTSIAEGRKGPARGGVLDGEQAQMLRALIAGQGSNATPKERGPARGLAKLLRRNPTDAERALWDALVNDRRFAGRGFKRQTPIGSHICDFVSFPLRVVVEIVPGAEDETARQARSDRHAWLTERGYRIIEAPVAEIEANIAASLERIDRSL